MDRSGANGTTKMENNTVFGLRGTKMGKKNMKQIGKMEKHTELRLSGMKMEKFN